MLSSSRMLMSVARRSRTTTRRNFGGSATPVVYEGAEAKIRAVLPKDEDIVLAWIGTMFGLYAVKKLFSGSSDEAPVEKHAAVVQTSASTEENAIPSILSEEFEEWSKVPGNMKKWEDSLKDYDFSKMKA